MKRSDKGKPSRRAKAREVRTSGRAMELAREKLKSSGLDFDDAKKLGIRVLDADETPKQHPMFKPLVALRFDYLDPVGRQLSDWPGCDPYFRIRYLEHSTDFTAQAKKQPRYVQPPNTAPVAYFPQNQPDWVKLCADVNQPLVVTEGELKAAKACKEGFPTLGIGGVYAWRSARHGITWLPSLDLVKWPRRNVYLCFDSDYRTNPMVCAALRDLAEALHQHGAFVHIVSLPAMEGMEKTGLDDLLTFGGANANATFGTLLHEAEPLGLTRPLWELNRKYVYVRDPGLIVEEQSGAKQTPSAFKEHGESTSIYHERDLKPDGSVSLKAASGAAAWLQWPLRREVRRMTYAPGHARVFEPEGGDGAELNLWTGWGCEPRKGDVKPFLKLLDHLFAGAEPGAKEWFLKWCAYPIQHPGTKMFSSAVLHGIAQGTGKSLVGYTLGRIYGKNFTEIDQEDLTANFNEWAQNKQFVMGDDITGSQRREHADLLKKLITQNELRVNMKYMPTYVVPDCINYLFTANHPDAFFLDDDDRRYFIHEVTSGPMDRAFYKAYDGWMRGPVGPGALFDFFLKLDLADFDPAASAYRTAAKERMIVRTRSDLASWVRDLVATPDAVLKVGEVVLKKDLFTSKDLLNVYDPSGRTGTTANGVAREMARAGVRQVCDGKPVRLKDGSQGRFFAVRNPEKWVRANATEVAAHVEGGPLARRKAQF